MAAKLHEFGKQHDPGLRGSACQTPPKSRIYRGSWIVTVPMVAIAVGYVTLFFMPGRQAIGETRQQIEQKQDYIAEAATLATALRATQQQLDAAEQYAKSWEDRSPAGGEISALYGKINALAERAGATTTRFDPEPVVAHDTIREIPLAMACTGSFGRIFEFLRSLEELPVEIWVKQCRLENLSGSRGSVNCELTLIVFADNRKNSDYAKYTE
ncbi:MAG: type 4a pilus biogenesis protein PilO [Pirellulales bacterium]|nr:type 4a pilus biogenesis protein PilO [Pirellulales bacterium]